jgi:hypothetical protein
MKRLYPFTLFSIAMLLAIVGCNLPGLSMSLGDEAIEISAIETPSMTLATPIAESPAAGICGELEGEIVTMTINPDMPDPRCLRVHGEQRLRVVNQRGETLEIALGRATASLQPGAEITFERSFGELLLPGVHALQVFPCCGGEIVLSAES